MPRTLLFCDGLRVAGLKPLTFNLNMREVNSRLQCKNMFANYSTFYPIANPESRIPNPESRIPNPESRIPTEPRIRKPKLAGLTICFSSY